MPKINENTTKSNSPATVENVEDIVMLDADEDGVPFESIVDWIDDDELYAIAIKTASMNDEYTDDPTPEHQAALTRLYNLLPSLMDVIAADLEEIGIVGERNLALAVYLVGTSRLLGKPLSAIVQGSSSTGKSFVVGEVAKLFPEGHRLDATRMTKSGLYRAGNLAHRFVVAGERSHAQGDEQADATSALRQLQSEGRLTQLLCEKEDGNWKGAQLTVEGPIAYVETTTLKPEKIFPEDLNRALLLKTDNSEAQTRKILDAKAAKYSDGTNANTDKLAISLRHKAFQAALKQEEVTIPFAGKLVAEIPARRVESRRVANHVLTMIEAITLLHQFERERDRQGRLVATMEDYRLAKELLNQPLTESLGVNTGAAELLAKLGERFSGENTTFSTTQAKTLVPDASPSSVKNWLGILEEQGCIELVTAGRGPKAATYALTGKAGDTILPTLE